MNWTIEKNENKNFFKIVTEGLFSVEDHQRMIVEITSRADWKPGMNAFFDNRKLDFSRSDISIMREAANNHVQNDPLIGNGRSAILMKTTTDFARGRQFEILTDNKISTFLRIFSDEAKALEWLDEAPAYLNNGTKAEKQLSGSM